MYHVDLPGIQKEHVDISVLGDLLTVTALRRRIHDEEQWKAHHRELEFGKVSRSDDKHSNYIFLDCCIITCALMKTRSNECFGFHRTQIWLTREPYSKMVY